MEKVTPELLKEIYHGKDELICKCKNIIPSYFLRNQCNCKSCKTGDDVFCVTMPRFTNYEIKCPFCGKVIKECERVKINVLNSFKKDY